MSRNRDASIVVVFLLALLSAPLSLYSAEKNQPQERPGSSDFSYSAQDRRDPFEPVYEAKTKKIVSDSKQKEGYELEELKLVGVIKTGNVKFAMMEDVQGRGMLFKKGDFLNTSLWLFDILDDKVILAHKLRGDIRKIPLDIPRK
jgi:Tfp pilus assembly protein PilP